MHSSSVKSGAYTKNLCFVGAVVADVSVDMARSCERWEEESDDDIFAGAGHDFNPLADLEDDEASDAEPKPKPSKVDEDGYSGGKLRCDLFSSAWCDVDHVTGDKSAMCDRVTTDQISQL